ncbi:MAG: hypothetical protein MUD02_07560 [Bacteroidales bacterium]|jgi:hypothetical protein|nr:hypothetical protein [Bacteroidales bacterium]MCU0408787.1 hypothetical protein [Bacteroidales bacterium]
MNKKIHDSSDPLRSYMNPGMLENAPDSMEAGIMSRIFLEPVKNSEPATKNQGLWISAISAGVVLALVLAAVILIPYDGIINIPFTGLSLNLDIAIPDFSFTELRSIDLPRILISISAGVILLSVLDKILYRAFHRDHD